MELRSGHGCVRIFTFRKNAKMTALSGLFCLSVRPSACIEQLGSHSTDFDEIVYLNIF